MIETIQQYIQSIGYILDIIGVLIILIGFIVASAVALWHLLSEFNVVKQDGHALYRRYRQDLARSILIGLEFLVAGDIIRTVSGDLTIEGVLVLAGIVVIRIVLGLALEAEIDPRGPSIFARLQR